MSLKVKKLSKNSAVLLSKNFKASEFSCNGKGCCSEVIYAPEVIERLQWMRDKCKKAIALHSGYRCEEHNKKVGGVEKSKHTLGYAADLKIPKGMTLDEFAALAESAGFRGVLKYTERNFVHVDVRETKPYYGLTATGDGFRSQKTFGGKVELNPGVKPTVTIKRRSTRLVNVLWIQFQLQKAGFEVGTLDGVFGVKTFKAVKDFQAARGLAVDGICGMGETVPALAQIG
ncbi:MAG: DUF882 domain-containing protein [Ruminococcaceae bacterium]|nr:DUF882 domain-containing protein [Oscillospiraceae bacterium]